MALKFRITQSAYDKLSDDVKAEYKEQDGSYVLDLTDYEDPAELRRARDREKRAAADAARERDELKDQLAEAQNKKNRENKDIDAIEADWKQKVADAEAKGEEQVGKANKFIEKLLVDNTAADLAAKISTAPKIIQRHIADRLTVDNSGDEPKAVVLKDGKPSEMSIEDLGNEFVANQDYAAIITGSKAKGSVTPSGTPSGGADTGNPPSNTDLSKANPKDLVAHIKSNREAAE